jgi:DNA-binding transcriptional ArsR family regulator
LQSVGINKQIAIYSVEKIVAEHINLNSLDAERLESVANMLKAIAHPMRIAILGLLEKDAKLTVSEIHQKLGIEQSTTSHHLGILKDKGVLGSKRDGKNTIYFLKHENFAKVIECVSRCPLH